MCQRVRHPVDLPVRPAGRLQHPSGNPVPLAALRHPHKPAHDLPIPHELVLLACSTVSHLTRRVISGGSTCHWPHPECFTSRSEPPTRQPQRLIRSLLTAAHTLPRTDAGPQTIDEEALGWPTQQDVNRLYTAAYSWLAREGSAWPRANDRRLDIVKVLFDERDKAIRVLHIEGSWQGSVQLPPTRPSGVPPVGRALRS